MKGLSSFCHERKELNERLVQSALLEKHEKCDKVFFYQNIYYNVQTNNLQSTKINQNNMIKMSQMINITLQPMQ